jgi:hypothetical protein
MACVRVAKRNPPICSESADLLDQAGRIVVQRLAGRGRFCDHRCIAPGQFVESLQGRVDGIDFGSCSPACSLMSRTIALISPTCRAICSRAVPVSPTSVVPCATCSLERMISARG